MDSNRQAVVVSSLFGLFAAFLVYTYVSQKERAIEKEFGESTLVFVASKDIEEMSQITRGSVEAREVPKKFIQPGALYANDTSFFDRGNGPIAAVPIKAGEQLADTKIIYDGARLGLAKKVSVNMRAISIPVNDQYGVGKLVKPGDRVDVLSPVRFAQGEIDRVEIKTVLQNVLVLATGENINNDPPRVFETDAFNGRLNPRSLTRDRNYNTVTLEVFPYDAQKITYLATQQGVLYLTLRNPTDAEVGDWRSTTQEEVLGANSKSIQETRRPAGGN